MVLAVITHSHLHGPTPWWAFPLEIGLLAGIFGFIYLVVWFLGWLEKIRKRQRRRKKDQERRKNEAANPNPNAD